MSPNYCFIKINTIQYNVFMWVKEDAVYTWYVMTRQGEEQDGKTDGRTDGVSPDHAPDALVEVCPRLQANAVLERADPGTGQGNALRDSQHDAASGTTVGPDPQSLSQLPGPRPYPHEQLRLTPDPPQLTQVRVARGVGERECR